MNILQKYRDLLAPYQSSIAPLPLHAFYYFHSEENPNCNAEAINWLNDPDDGSFPFRYVDSRDIRALGAIKEGTLTERLSALRLLSLRYSAVELADLFSLREAIYSGALCQPDMAQQLIDILWGLDYDISEDAFTMQSCKLPDLELESASSGCFSIAPSEPKKSVENIRFKIMPQHESPEELQEKVLEMRELRAKALQVLEDINDLKNANALAVLAEVLGKELIDQLTHPNRIQNQCTLRIDNRFRILLSEYDIEIKMNTLPKALYILFLRHPEGIDRMCLDEHKEELRTIYLTISNRTYVPYMNSSIDDLVEPGSTSLNEKISRINAAFRGALAPDMAEQFVIAGPRGEAKRVQAASSAQLPEELRF